MTTPAGGNLLGSATIRVDGDTDPAMRAIRQFSRDAQGRLRDLRGRFVSESNAMGRALGDTSRGGGRLTRALSSLQDSIRGIAGAAQNAAVSLGPGAGGMSGALVGVGVAAGITALPAVGALVPALAGLGAAAVTAKLAFGGVSDAVALAGKDSQKYADALKKMGPQQQEFTKTVVAVKEEFAGLGKEVQKIVLPSFTRALKAADPVIGIVKDAVRDMSGVFADLGDQFAKLFGSSRFQKALRDNFALGAGFLRQITAPLGTLTQSILDFGAASKPTLDAFGKGIAGLLGKGLPGFLDGLKAGIGGSAQLFTGLFNAINQVLPALGEFIGQFANAAGPALREIAESAGTTAAGALRDLAGAMKFLKPLFGELGGAARITSFALQVIGDIAKNVGKVLLESLWPSFGEAQNAVGPLQSLATWLKNNQQAVLEFSRVASNFILSFVQLAITQLPNVIHAFRLMATGILTALDVIVSGAAASFGWIPGLGPKFQAANREFDQFKNAFITGLHTAENMSRDFANKVTPRLQQNKLRMNIDNWTAQIKAAQGQLAKVPPEKRAKLLANIADLVNKVRRAKADLASVLSKTVTVSVFYKSGKLPGSGTVLAPGRAAGGMVGGVGTGTSDSNLIRASRGEFVVQAAAVRKYGAGLFEQLNAMRLGTGAALAGAGGDLIVGMVDGVRSMARALAVSVGAAMAGAVAAAKSVLGISSPSRVFAAIGKDVGRGLLKGLTGTRAQINSTAKNLADDITRAFRGRRTRVDDRLVNLVESSNRRLQGLADQRDKLSARIQQAQQFAKDLTSQALGAFSLQAVTADTVASPLRIEQGLVNARKAIRRFTANIRRLQKLGLRKDLIQQILGLGPEQGAQLAAALAGQSKTYIKHINKLQSDVASSATTLGRLGADALFDSGKKAGEGFLTGLKAQRKSIEQLMLSIAKSIQKAIRKALGIESPSTVFAGLGALTAQGFIVGLTGRIPALEAATGRMSAAVAAAGAATVRPAVSAAVRPAALLPAGTVGVTRPVAAATAASVYVTVNVANHGVLGSPREVEVFFMKTLETLRRQRRLPFAVV